MPALLTRRHFTALAAAALTTRTKAQSALTPIPTIEHDHILSDAAQTKTPATLLELSATIAAQTAAFLLTKDPTYATKTQIHLTTLLKQSTPTTTEDLLPYAEIAVALRHLVDALPTELLSATNSRLATIQTFLNEDPTATLDRDHKDHRASVWLLLASAIARSQRSDSPLGTTALDACRARFRHPTLRNQINADGIFPQELASDNPLRNTLFNFDLLAASCQLLASPFDDLWHYELIDGPGLRSVAAYLVPKIQAPATWPTVSDASHFRDVPLRRPALLFAGRAFNRPEYVNLYRTLPPPDLTKLPPEILTTFPIHQPLLWTAKAPHGL